ncbi:GHKL domain-containing protein [Candidatus Woesearchaeota archaeon]|nr:GHKL domain-containing protein [Candidatus Woesearchaeota archaeon]
MQLLSVRKDKLSLYFVANLYIILISKQGYSNPGAIGMSEESDIEKELKAIFGPDDSVDEDRLSRFVRAEKHSVLGFLVSSVAHDSNNLITPIIGLAEAGKRSAEEIGDTENAFLYGTILSSAEKLNELMRNLLNFSKRGEFTRGTVYFNQLLNSVISLYEFQYNSKGIKLVADLNDVPEVDGYPGGLETVFTNMMQNAMHAYGGLPKERSKNVYVRSYHKEKYVFIEFEDDGCGIKETDLPRIFDAWYTTKGSKGHGIGLAVARRIVKSHWGKILVDSEYGKGAKFTIRIPDKHAVQVMREETFFGPRREPASEN